MNNNSSNFSLPLEKSGPNIANISPYCKDEIANIISFLSNKKLDTRHDILNGYMEECTNILISCHEPGFGYFSDRDSNIEKHRSMHNPLIDRGIFWGTLKRWVIKEKRFPALKELLNIQEIYLDLFIHSDCHPDEYPMIDMLIGGLQSVFNEPLEFSTVGVDGSCKQFLNTDCICSAPGCSFVGFNREELEAHILRRNDDAHSCFRECGTNYGDFYGPIKAHILTNGSIPSIVDLWGGHNHFS